MDRTRAAPAFVLAACCALLAACGGGDRDAAARQSATDAGAEAPLPRPGSASGSITGMPDGPGPGPVGDSVVEGDVAVAPEGDEGLPALSADALPAPPGGEAAPPSPSQQAQVSAPAEPTPEEAAAVVEAYYAAIAAGQYPRAYALWSGGGQASGQSAQQFAAGFGDTASVSVDVGKPGRVDAAAGSRYVEVPVTVAATRTDGSIHRYAGAYTLRRAVVDGASAEQRAWRIASADLREVQP